MAKINDKKKSAPISPMLTVEEKIIAKNFGHSLDAQLWNHDPEVDLEKMSYCMALAVKKHIDFSWGFLFKSDLQTHGNLIDEDWVDLWFSYNFKDALKLKDHFMNQY